MAKPRIISLFTGAGGLDFGFEAAGFDTAVAVEFDHDCCETMRANRPGWYVIERSIFDVPSSEMIKHGRFENGEVDVLIGGPPCQPFSKSGYWARGDSARLEDPRASTLAAYLRVLRDTTPRAFLLENVEGLAYEGKDEGLQLLLDTIRRINRDKGTKYEPRIQVLNAADFGVPQLRQRVLLVGSRDGKDFKFPRPTHSADSADALTPHRTAWDALADVRPAPGEDVAVRGKWRNLLPTIPEGENYLFHTDKTGKKPALFGWRRRYWCFLLKLAKNRPSWTIQAQPGPAIGPFHWDNRRLSMRELCRLQTFPDDVTIKGSRQSVQKQVGNAVPSLLAEVVARAIRTQLLGRRAMPGSPKLMPPDRSPAPPPDPVVRDIPFEYRKYLGYHEAHPGTGKGYGARARERLAG